MSYQKLYNYGLSSRFEQEALLYPGLQLARVTSQHRQLYTVMTENGEMQGSVSGKFVYQADNDTTFPAVGDWVMVSQSEDGKDEGGRVVIHHVLQRKSVFERKAAGTQHSAQIVASNIDVIFICMSLNNDFNLRRLERYLSIAWESAATPVIVLTKSDLCFDLPDKLAEIETMNMGADVLVTSALDADVRQQFLPYLGQEKTVVFLGSSGVGKSSLINLLLGKDVLVTQEVGSDDSGKHTTTHRQLFALTAGGVVIDTPGMRELQLETANLSRTFEDIEQLALQCKFNNCTHTTEGGCAVQQAMADGVLSEARLENYRKLEKEVQYGGLNSKQRERAKINNMFGSMREYKQTMQHAKNKRYH